VINTPQEISDNYKSATIDLLSRYGINEKDAPNFSKNLLANLERIFTGTQFEPNQLTKTTSTRAQISTTSPTVATTKQDNSTVLQDFTNTENTYTNNETINERSEEKTIFKKLLSTLQDLNENVFDFKDKQRYGVIGVGARAVNQTIEQQRKQSPEQIETEGSTSSSFEKALKKIINFQDGIENFNNRLENLQERFQKYGIIGMGVRKLRDVYKNKSKPVNTASEPTKDPLTNSNTPLTNQTAIVPEEQKTSQEKTLLQKEKDVSAIAPISEEQKTSQEKTLLQKEKDVSAIAPISEEQKTSQEKTLFSGGKQEVILSEIGSAAEATLRDIFSSIFKGKGVSEEITESAVSESSEGGGWQPGLLDYLLMYGGRGRGGAKNKGKPKKGGRPPQPRDPKTGRFKKAPTSPRPGRIPVGRALPVVGTALAVGGTAYYGYQAYQGQAEEIDKAVETGELTEQEAEFEKSKAAGETTGRTGAELATGLGGAAAGGWAGAKTGALAGGIIGSVIPGVGNVAGAAAGGIAGGIIGAIGGWMAGSSIGEATGIHSAAEKAGGSVTSALHAPKSPEEAIAHGKLKAQEEKGLIINETEINNINEALTPEQWAAYGIGKLSDKEFDSLIDEFNKRQEIIKTTSPDGPSEKQTSSWITGKNVGSVIGAGLGAVIPGGSAIGSAIGGLIGSKADSTEFVTPIDNTTSTINNISNNTTNDKTLEEIATNTEKTNNNLNNLGQAILKLAQAFQDNKPNPSQNIIVNSNNESENIFSASMAAANNNDPIRRVRQMFMPA